MQTENKSNPESTKAKLLAEIEIFLANNPSVSAEGFGWLACRSADLVKRLRNGGDTSTGNLDKCLEFLLNPIQNRKSYGANRKRKTQSE